METIQLTIAENTRYEIQLVAVKCGKDYSVTICGGDKHHVGAVAHASPHKNISGNGENSATVSSISALAHRDDELARMAAKKLSAELECYVSVSAGVHIDSATPEELKMLVSNTIELCAKFVATQGDKTL